MSEIVYCGINIDIDARADAKGFATLTGTNHRQTASPCNKINNLKALKQTGAKDNNQTNAIIISQ